MSAANCPETPRQKMISLMYLVLTAMLAINLSPTVLEGFKDVNDGLVNTNKNFVDRNNIMYDLFDQQQTKNPDKVTALNDKAKKIKDQCDSMNAMIEEYKKSLAQAASGGKPVDPDSLSEDNMSDPDASALMLEPNSKKGQELRDAYYGFKLAILDQLKDVKQASEILPAINGTIKVPGPDDRTPELWEYSLFESRPVITSITLLTKIQNDVRNVESISIQHLFKQIDASDFKFNKMEAIIVPTTSSYIIKGGVFEANVVVAAVDTTKRPDVIADGKKLNKGVMNYSIPTSGMAAGEKTTRVVVNIENPDGKGYTELNAPFTFQVVEPSATVSALKMNVLYTEVQNPLKISVPGVSDDQVKPEATNGTLKSIGVGTYEIKPTSSSPVCTISVYAMISNKKTFITKTDFRVKQLPNPVPYMMNGTDHFYGGKIARDVLLKQPGLLAELKDVDFDAPHVITGFGINFFDAMGNSKLETSADANFTSAQKQLLRNLKRGDKVFISNIKAVGPGKIVKNLVGSMEVVVN